MTKIKNDFTLQNGPKFQLTIWCGGSEKNLVVVYDDRVNRNWDNMHSLSPIFIHKGHFHGLYE